MKQKLKILVVEDNHATALEYEIILQELDLFDTTLVSTIDQATRHCNKHKQDIIILDIGLQAHLDGIDFAKSIIKDDILIIFATVSNDTETYERAITVKPFAYLIKPFSLNSLKSLLISAHKQIIANNKSFSTAQSLSTTFFLKKGSVLHRIQLNELLAVQSDGNYCTIITINEELKLKKPLYQLKEKFTSGQIIQIHRSCLINLSNIDSINLTKNQVSIKEYHFPIGEKYKNELVKRLQKF